MNPLSGVVKAALKGPWPVWATDIPDKTTRRFTYFTTTSLPYRVRLPLL